MATTNDQETLILFTPSSNGNSGTYAAPASKVKEALLAAEAKAEAAADAEWNNPDNLLWVLKADQSQAKRKYAEIRHQHRNKAFTAAYAKLRKTATVCSATRIGSIVLNIWDITINKHPWYHQNNTYDDLATYIDGITEATATLNALYYANTPDWNKALKGGIDQPNQTHITNQRDKTRSVYEHLANYSHEVFYADLKEPAKLAAQNIINYITGLYPHQERDRIIALTPAAIASIPQLEVGAMSWQERQSRTEVANHSLVLIRKYLDDLDKTSQTLLFYALAYLWSADHQRTLFTNLGQEEFWRKLDAIRPDITEAMARHWFIKLNPMRADRTRADTDFHDKT
jgi:hypothetical protein